jgi:hypothetical protein
VVSSIFTFAQLDSLHRQLHTQISFCSRDPLIGVMVWIVPEKLKQQASVVLYKTACRESMTDAYAGTDVFWNRDLQLRK